MVALLALGRGQPRAARLLLDPMITAARAFGLSHTLGSALKLRVAAAMNDKVAARSIMATSTREEQNTSPDWSLSQSRWHRSQRNIDAALDVARWGKPKNPAQIFLCIESARLHLATGDTAGATSIIEETMAVCEEKNYRELASLAALVRGALGLILEDEWQHVLHKSRSSPWVELSLTSLAMAGRRHLLREERTKPGNCSRRCYSEPTISIITTTAWFQMRSW